MALTVSWLCSEACFEPCGSESNKVETPLLVSRSSARSDSTHSGMMMVRAAPTSIPIPSTETAFNCFPSRQPASIDRGPTGRS
jgi:hypothetical protein